MFKRLVLFILIHFYCEIFFFAISALLSRVNTQKIVAEDITMKKNIINII